MDIAIILALALVALAAVLLATQSRSKRTLLDMAASEIERLTARCARYAEEIAALQERTRWIPVTERLPEYTVCVLVAYSNGAVEVDAWGHDGWMDEDLSNGAITHWMPVPELPEVERNE